MSGQVDAIYYHADCACALVTYLGSIIELSFGGPLKPAKKGTGQAQLTLTEVRGYRAAANQQVWQAHPHK